MSRSPLLRRIALASLVVLMFVSFAFVAVAPASIVARIIPPGLVLAIAKVAALAFVFVRVRAANTYSMQWSSMFILLFIAEGTVRAGSDPQPSALLGIVETLAAAIYFAAVLALLRPLKQAARKTDVPSDDAARP